MEQFGSKRLDHNTGNYEILNDKPRKQNDFLGKIQNYD